jgi:hypothetical protein
MDTRADGYPAVPLAKQAYLRKYFGFQNNILKKLYKVIGADP